MEARGALVTRVRAGGITLADYTDKQILLSEFPLFFPIRVIREGMMFVSGASWVTQEAVAGRTETRSP
jgi:hypothetical protein